MDRQDKAWVTLDSNLDHGLSIVVQVTEHILARLITEWDRAVAVSSTIE
jgi:hypothetical protein